MTSADMSAPHQRIAMACQYCRHRKIRCCGSAPCVNCTRTGHTCGYSPVSEEANRLTRQKKAAAKAAKVSYRAIRMAPSDITQTVNSVPYLPGPGPIHGTHVPVAKRFSTPGIHAASLPAYWPVPPAPAMPSSAKLESPCRPAMVINDLPMVLVHTAMTHKGIYEADDASSYATGTGTPMTFTEWPASRSYPMPVTPLKKALPNTPPHNTLSYTYNQALFQSPDGLTYTPHPFPFSPASLSLATFPNSPTLYAGQVVKNNQPQHLQQPLLGLGIGLPYAHASDSSTVGNENPRPMATCPSPTSTWCTSRQGQQQMSIREGWTLRETNI